MKGSRSPSPREELELSMLEGQAEEQAPLNSLQIQPCSAAAEDPSPAQMDKESSWSPCNKPVVGNCKLWMVIVTIFLCFTLVTVMSLCLVGDSLTTRQVNSGNTQPTSKKMMIIKEPPYRDGFKCGKQATGQKVLISAIDSICDFLKMTYVDEDETEILELSSNKTFFIVLKIPEECVNEEELHHLLNKRLTDVYRESPALGRFFTSADMMDFSVENATVTYHLQFGVPAEDDGFIKHMLSEELVLGIMRQNFHDKNLSGCERLGLDPESLLLYE